MLRRFGMRLNSTYYSGLRPNHYRHQLAVYPAV
jgi:hypothetical protein